MNKRLTVSAITAIFVSVLFLGAAESPNRAVQKQEINIRGAVLQLGTVTDPESATQANWDKVSGGADVIEVAETTVNGMSGYTTLATVTPAIPDPNEPCYQLIIGARTLGQFLPPVVLTVNIQGIEELWALADKLCPWRNGGNVTEKSDIALICKNANGKIIRRYILRNLLPTFSESSEFTTESKANEATLVVQIGHVEFK